MSSRSEIRKVFFNNIATSIRAVKSYSPGAYKSAQKNFMLGFIEGMEFAELISSLEYSELKKQIEGL